LKTPAKVVYRRFHTASAKTSHPENSALTKNADLAQASTPLRTSSAMELRRLL
jgi:hypothetical protein